MNFYQQLLSPETYQSIFRELEKKSKNDFLLLNKAPIYKNLTLRWCLNNQNKLIKYFQEQVRKQTYAPQLRHQNIISVDKERTVYSINWVDKIFEQALSRLLFKHASGNFSSSLYSHRPGFSNRLALTNLASYFKANLTRRHFIIKKDIKSYTDTINPELFVQQFAQQCPNQHPYFWTVLRSFISPDYLTLHTKQPAALSLGAPTGSSLTNFIANFYLQDLDFQLAEKVDFYIRFGDDFFLTTQNLDSILESEKLLSQTINERGLNFNTKKTQRIIFNAEEEVEGFTPKHTLEYLGYKLSHKGSIFLDSSKEIKLKRNLQFLIRKGIASKKTLPKEQLLIQTIQQVNFIIKNYQISNYLGDLIFFCDDSLRIKRLDAWLASTILAFVFRTNKKNAFVRCNFKETRSKGLLSLQYFKHLKFRGHEF